ncbi:MAG: twin-arginine translocase TatA/TatE family subunit [Anaerolineae bacterium]
MPQIGVPELLIVLVIIITIFGAGKLPQVGSAIGQSIREFRSSSKGQDEAGEKNKPEATQTG